jgi:hypothetical protein
MLEFPNRERGFKKERILRVLLNHPDGELSKYRVAKEADGSGPWVREYTEQLEQQGLIEETTVRRPRELYEEWRNIRVEPNQVTVALQQPVELLEEIDLDFALTTYQAEHLVQSYLFPSKTDLYIQPQEADDWTKLIEERGLLGGGNTRIRVTDDHVFYGTAHHGEHTVVSTPQLIVDLLDVGGHCEEAAEKLIETVHGRER